MMQRRTFLIQSAGAVAAVLAGPSACGRKQGHRPLVRYPDSAIVTLNPRFEKYRQDNAAVERLWTGARWAEGPVWFGDGRFLLFSDIPNNRILRWTEETGEVSIFRSPSNYANGHTRDRQGRLVHRYGSSVTYWRVTRRRRVEGVRRCAARGARDRCG